VSTSRSCMNSTASSALIATVRIGQQWRRITSSQLEALTLILQQYRYAKNVMTDCMALTAARSTLLTNWTTLSS